MRTARTIVAALLVTAAAPVAIAAAAPAPVASITVVVCDQAGAAHDVADAAQLVGHLYRKAGIGIRWVDGCDESVAGGLRLNIRLKPTIDDGPIPESALGYAAAETRTASVRFDRINRTASLRRVPRRDVLAAVIAHELGHLLLGYGAHAATGIMQASFDMGGVSLWGLAFSRDQASKMVRSINGGDRLAASVDVGR